MPNNDPWYTRTEFWTALASLLQAPAITAIPNSSKALNIASAVLAVLGPIVYMFGRGKVKETAVRAGLTPERRGTAPALPGSK